MLSVILDTVIVNDLYWQGLNYLVLSIYQTGGRSCIVQICFLMLETCVVDVEICMLSAILDRL